MESNNNKGVVIRPENKPIYEQNIALLKGLGFVFDRNVYMTDKERLLLLQQNNDAELGDCRKRADSVRPIRSTTLPNNNMNNNHKLELLAQTGKKNDVEKLLAAEQLLAAAKAKAKETEREIKGVRSLQQSYIFILKQTSSLLLSSCD